MAYSIQKSNTTLPLRFLLVLTSDHITGATGKTPTVTIAKADGLGFITPTGAITALGQGWYEVAANATDANTLGPLTLHATASACDPSDEEYVVVDYNPTGVALQATTDTSTTSVLQLITSALRRIKVLQEGETAGAAMVVDAIALLNDLIDSYAGVSLLKYAVTRTTFTLVSTKGKPGTPYTVGSGGDINIARPVGFHRVGFQDNSLTTPIEYQIPLLTEAAYAWLPQKTLTGPWPNSFYYEPTFPLGSLYVWMLPTASNLVGVLYEETAVPKFGALTDLVALPPGYARLLREQLCLELWPEYRDGPVPASIAQAVSESRAQIKSNNVRMMDLVANPLARGWYDINSDRTF